MTLADTAPAERRTGLDLSWPILIAFAAILVLLIVLPMSIRIGQERSKRRRGAGVTMAVVIQTPKIFA